MAASNYITSIVDDGTLPDTSGCLVQANSDAYSYVKIDPSHQWVDNQITGTIWAGGYHAPSSSLTSYSKFALSEKHKVYKIFSSLMNTYRKDKRKFEIRVNDNYSIGNSSIRISMEHNPISITFFNKKENQTEVICSIGDSQNEVLAECVSKFIEKHAEEFMYFAEEELKKDLKEFAKKERGRLEESMEYVDMIKDME